MPSWLAAAGQIVKIIRARGSWETTSQQSLQRQRHKEVSDKPQGQTGKSYTWVKSGKRSRRKLWDFYPAPRGPAAVTSPPDSGHHTITWGSNEAEFCSIHLVLPETLHNSYGPLAWQLMSEISAPRGRRHNWRKTDDSQIDVVSCGTTREQNETLKNLNIRICAY